MIDFMDDHPLLCVITALVIIAGGVWAIASYLGPCHSQHAELRYYPAYDTTHCTFRDDDGICYAYTTHHHPAHCSWTTVCDVRCKDWDKGQMEAHPKHEPHSTPNITDPRCQGSLR